MNIEICDDKTRRLMRDMQGFQQRLIYNIKAYLPHFKHLSRLFSKYVTRFILFLKSGYNAKVT